MQIELTERFKKSYKAAPLRVRKDFQKQSRFLLLDLRHPSLRAKKYDESQGVWQARVNRDWRFYFIIEADIYFCLDIIRHPK